jgi:hypothetical protein
MTPACIALQEREGAEERAGLVSQLGLGLHPVLFCSGLLHSGLAGGGGGGWRGLLEENYCYGMELMGAKPFSAPDEKRGGGPMEEPLVALGREGLSIEYTMSKYL